MNEDYFAGRIIGQDRVRCQLSHYIDVHRHTEMHPNLLMLAAKGNGKTTLCRAVGEFLGKEFIELNGTELKSAIQLYEQVLQPEIIGRNVTLFIDEVHAIEKKVDDFLLQILVPPPNGVTNTIRFKNTSFVIDFRQFTFLAATTEAHKVSDALRRRLKQITLPQYSFDELKQIIQIGAKTIILNDILLDFLVKYVRNNASSAEELGKSIYNYCLVHRKKKLTLDDIKRVLRIENIYEWGFTALEVEILKSIATSGSASLTRLAAKSGLTPQMQRNIERDMLARDLIDIDGGRKITRNGMEYLKRNEIN